MTAAHYTHTPAPTAIEAAAPVAQSSAFTGTSSCFSEDSPHIKRLPPQPAPTTSEQAQKKEGKKFLAYC